MRTMLASAALTVAILAIGRWAQGEIDRAWPDLGTALRHPADYDGRPLWVALAHYREGRLHHGPRSIAVSGMPPDISDGAAVTAYGRLDAQRRIFHVEHVRVAHSDPWRQPVDYAVSGVLLIALLVGLGRSFRWTIGPGRMLIRRT